MILRIHITLLIALFYNLYVSKKKIFFITYLFIIMHELAHMIVALMLSIDVEEITLLPFGATAKYKGNISLKKEFLVAIAGPVASIIFAFVYRNHTYFLINIIITFFNLIPIYPLDGGRIIRVIDLFLFKDKIGSKVFQFMNNFFIILLTIVSIFFCITIKNYYLFFISIYLIKISKQHIKKEMMQDTINYLQMNK